MSFHEKHKSTVRIIFLHALFVIVGLTMTLHVFAHPGKTDSSGGHYDRSTGEYHYHHGFSAHEHYDMNGDGIIDCPYDFKDETNHNTNHSSYVSSSSTRSIKNSGTSSVMEEVLARSKEKKEYQPPWYHFLIFIPIIFILFLPMWLQLIGAVVDHHERKKKH